MNSSEVEALVRSAVGALEESQERKVSAAISLVLVMVLTVELFANQAGFALLEAGSVRVRHEKAVLSKNLLDLSFGVLAWYLVGFAVYNSFARATDESEAAGSALFKFQDLATDDLLHFPELLKLSGFAVTMNTILSGAVRKQANKRLSLQCKTTSGMMTGYGSNTGLIL